MHVEDLAKEQDVAKAHQHIILLWPKLWKGYLEGSNYQFTWSETQFVASEANSIPTESGIYTFVVKPQLAGHPSCGYLMYIGRTKRTFRKRFREYLSEMQRESGRPLIVNVLNKYKDNCFFCYATVSDDQDISAIEDALVVALRPPCNVNLPAKVHRVLGALR